MNAVNPTLAERVQSARENRTLTHVSLLADRIDDLDKRVVAVEECKKNGRELKAIALLREALDWIASYRLGTGDLLQDRIETFLEDAEER